MDYTADVSDIAADAPAGDPRLGTDHPRGYKPEAGLVDAVNVALMLNRPLLVTGEPGTGKTQLAHSIAWQLASRKRLGVASPAVEKFEAKSTSTSRDLFYTFDLVSRFHASHVGGSANNLDYITYNALGRALIEASPKADVATYLPKTYEYKGPRRCVVLIDEIDKSPRDFPNDLLNEIQDMYFRIPELDGAEVGSAGRAAEELKPIVIITSNSEKPLPEPFLRRCIYYNIPPPETVERLEEILLARLRQRGASPGKLIGEAAQFLLQLRDRNIKRKISPAELIQWLTVMLRLGARTEQSLREAEDAALKALSALVKDREDREPITDELKRFKPA